MSPLKAKQLLTEFYLKSNKHGPIRLEVERLYTPDLRGHGVTFKTSLNGRLSQFFNYKDSKNERVKKIAKIFAEALAVLIKAKDHLPEIKDASWKARLFQEFSSEKVLKSALPASLTLGTDDIQAVEMQSAENIRLEQQKKRLLRFKKSLLREAPVHFKPEDEGLEALIASGIFSPAFRNAYYNYLRSSPGLAAQDLDQKATVVEQIIQDQASIQHEFFDRAQALTPQERAQKIKEGAEIICKTLQLRDPGLPWVFAGSYGRKTLDMEKLFSLLKLLPESARGKLPDFLQKASSLSELPKPDEFIESQISTILSKAEGKMEEMQNGSSLAFMRFLTVDSSRKLPSVLQKIMPEALGKALEAKLQVGLLENIKPLLNVLNAGDERELPAVIKKWLPQIFSQKLEASVKKGLIGTLIAVYEHSLPREVFEPFSLIFLNRDLLDRDPDGQALQLLDHAITAVSCLPTEASLHCLELVSLGLGCAADKEKYEEVRSKLVKKIEAYSSVPAKKAFQASNQVVGNVMDSLRQAFPPQLLELFGLDSLVSYGEFWMEFTKTPEGNFDIAIYSSGHIHELKRPDQGGSMEWPLKLKDVSADKLSQDFFVRMLTHHIEPQFDLNFTPKASEFINGILEYLEGMPGPTVLRTFNRPITTKEELLDLLLLHPDAPLGVPLFNMRFHALLAYLNRFLKAHSRLLDLKTDEEVSSVLEALQVVQNDYVKLKPLIPEQERERIEATFAEICEAVNLRRLETQVLTQVDSSLSVTSANPRLQLDDTTVSALKRIFRAVNVDSEAVKSLKPILLWGFGEEIEDFIHALADIAGEKEAPSVVSNKVQPSDLQPQDPEKPKGWIKEILASWQYTLALSALKTAIAAARLYQYSSGLQLTYALNWGLYCVLPEKIYEWYHLVLGTIARKMLEVLTKLILKCVLSPNAREELYQSVGQLKDMVLKAGKRLMGTSELDFQLVQPWLVADREIQVPLSTCKMQDTVKISSTSLIARSYPRVLAQRAKTPDPFLLEFELDAWLSNARVLKQTSPLYALQYLIERIKTLPIPSRKVNPYWDLVSPTDTALAAIQDLGIELNNSARLLYKKTCDAECTVSMYALLAMVEHLFRKLPNEDLKEFNLNFWDLALWSSTKGIIFKDPLWAKKLDEILEFCGIKIDPDQTFDSAEWEKKAKNSLFFYPIARRDVIFSNGANAAESAYIKERLRQQPVRFLKNILEIAVSKEALLAKVALHQGDFSTFEQDELARSVLNILLGYTSLSPEDLFEKKTVFSMSIENIFFLPGVTFRDLSPGFAEEDAKRLQTIKTRVEERVYTEFKKLIFERLSEPDYEAKYPKFAKHLEEIFIDEKVSQSEQLRIIHAHSNCFNEGQRFFSKAYLILRQHTLLCSAWVRKEVSFFNGNFSKTFPTLPLYFKFFSRRWLDRCKDSVVGCWTPMHSDWDSLTSYRDWTREGYLNYQGRSFGMDMSTFVWMNDSKRTQSEILAQPIENQRNGDSDCVEEIFCEPRDGVIRHLGHIRSSALNPSEPKDAMKLERLLSELRHFLFSYQVLDRQCEENPNWIFAFRDFVMSYFDRIDSDSSCGFYLLLVILSLNLKKYISHLPNGHEFDFEWIEPLFTPLKNLIASRTENSKLADQVVNTILVLQSSAWSPTPKVNLQLAQAWANLCLSNQKDHLLHLLITTNSHQLVADEQKNCDVQQWLLLPEILEALNVDQFRFSFFAQLGNALGFPEMLKAEEWESVSEGVFSNRGYKIDFCSRSSNFLRTSKSVKKEISALLANYQIFSPVVQLTPDNYATSDGQYRVECKKKVLETKVIRGKEFFLADPNKFELSSSIKAEERQKLCAPSVKAWVGATFVAFLDSSDEIVGFAKSTPHPIYDAKFLLSSLLTSEEVDQEFRDFTSPLESFEHELELYRVVGEKKYKPVSNWRNLWLDGTTHIDSEHFDLPKIEHLWIEDSDSPLKDVILEPPHSTLQFSVDQNVLKIKVKAKHDALKPVLSDGVMDLEILKRFDEFECFAKPNARSLAAIRFIQSGLEFAIIEENGKNVAKSLSQFPGFAIAPTQYDPYFSQFGNYLLLQNDKEERKLLLRRGGWFEHVAFRFMPQVGEWGYKLTEFLNQVKYGRREGFFAFQVTKAHRLTSEDPEALLELLTIYIVQQDFSRAEKICGDFERLCRKGPLVRVLHNELMPFLLATSGCHFFEKVRDFSSSTNQKTVETLTVPLKIAKLRQRLLAALEENYLLHPQEKPSKESDLIVQLFLVATTLNDLHERAHQNQPEKTIDDFQEWLLYQLVFRTLRSLILGQKVIPESAKKSLDFIGVDALVENFALTEALAQRYKSLKAKFKEKDSFLSSSLLFAKKAYFTPSPLTKLENQARQTLSENQLQSSLPAVTRKLKNKLGLKQKNAQSTLEFVRQMLWTKVLDLKVLKAEQFYRITQILTPICLNAAEITPDQFKANFLAYCKIALTQSDSENTKRLSTFLNLIQGGWDPQTAILVRMLCCLEAHPNYFWNYEKFELAFAVIPEGEAVPTDKPTVEELFAHINHRIFVSKAFQLGGKFLLDRIFNDAYQGMLLSALPRVKALPSVLSFASTLISPATALKIVHAGGALTSAALDKFKTRNCDETPANRLAEAEQTRRFNSLDSEDRCFDEFLGGTLLNLLFELTEWKGRDVKLEKFAVTPSASHAVKESYARVNQSIDDYYQRADRLPQGARVKNLEAIYEAYVLLVSMRDSVNAQLEKHLERIVKLCKRSVTFESIKKAFLEGDLSPVVNQEGVKLEQIHDFELVVARYIVRHTRLQQMNRAALLFEEIIRLEPRSQAELFETKIEQLVDELLVKRVYNFSDEDPRFLRRLMVFEFTTQKMLWKKQVERLKDLLIGPNKTPNTVIELLMSLGKTWLFVPFIDSYEAEGKIVCNIFPAAIAETNIRQIGNQSHEIYNQSSNVFRFTRSKILNRESLDAYLLVLQRVLENRETINMTKEDAQALELIFVDRLHRYSLSNQNKSSEKAVLERLKKMLALLRHSGKAIGDEAHIIFDCHQELNYPLGSPVTISPNYYDVMELVMRKLVKISEVFTLLRENNLNHLLVTNGYEESVIQVLSVKLINHPLLAVEMEKRREGACYLAGKTQNVPEWIKNHPNYELIALIKGLLTVLLPLTFSRTVNVDFGMSAQNNGEYARPYEGNTSPLEQASIRNPYEAAVKTFIQFLHNGLTDLQYTKLRLHLKAKAVKEAKLRKLPVSETPSEKLLTKWDTTSEANRKGRFHPEAALLYVRLFVKNQIKYWRQNIRSNAQDFASMFASGFFDTGTPYNSGTYPANLKMSFDPGTIGEALHLIKTKCPEDGLHELKESRPEKILQEVLARFFMQHSNFTALIDGSALLEGLDNQTVAKAMMQFVETHRPDIKGIVYFTKDEAGKEQLVCLKRGTSVPVHFDLCYLKPEEYLSYYDQRHGFGADIPQKANAKGLNLVGERLSLQRLMQECFRMRGIKKRKRLEGIPGNDEAQDEIDSTQSIHFAFTPQTKKAMGNGSSFTLHDIFKFAIENEAKKAAEDNFESYKQKVSSTIRRAVFDKMETASTLDETLEIFEEFTAIVVQKVEDNPKHLFGPIARQQSPLGNHGVLQVYREHVYAMIAHSSSFSEAEKEEIRKTLENIAIEPMPETVQVFSDGDKSTSGLLDDLNKEVQVEVENEAETETEAENETETENEVESSVRNHLSGPSFKENVWIGAFDPHAMDLLSPCLKEQSRPPFFSLENLLSTHSIAELRKIAKAFDRRIIVSNNFVPTQVSLFESPVELGSYMQRGLYEVLVQYRPLGSSFEIVKVACLSQRDAAAMRENFLKHRFPSGQKAFLYDIVNRVPVAGTQMDVEHVRQHPELCLIEAQLKFLNGDVNYGKILLKALKTWFKQGSFQAARAAFEHIHAARGKKPLFATDLEEVFEKYTVKI